jgi:hypothetical protein
MEITYFFVNLVEKSLPLRGFMKHRTRHEFFHILACNKHCLIMKLLSFEQDDRSAYVNNFFDHLVSWNSVMMRMMRAEAFVNLGEPNVPVA